MVLGAYLYYTWLNCGILGMFRIWLSEVWVFVLLEWHSYRRTENLNLIYYYKILYYS